MVQFFKKTSKLYTIKMQESSATILFSLPPSGIIELLKPILILGISDFLKINQHGFSPIVRN